VTAAKLRLFGNRPTASTVADGAYAVPDNTWNELTINWVNKPMLGAKQGGSVIVGATMQYYEWDVASFVASQKMAGATAVNLAVKMDTPTNDSPDAFNAKEAGTNRPQLVVTTSP
jgi:hypothetical protein